MADGRSSGHEDHHIVQRTKHFHQSPQTSSTPQAAPPYSVSLLGDSRLAGRGNSSVRKSIMLQMQRTYGNRAVQRLLHNARGTQALPTHASTLSGTSQPATIAIQRRIVISPEAYASGLKVSPGELTVEQLNEYLNIAVFDDMSYAFKLANKNGNEEKATELKNSFAAIKSKTEITAKIEAVKGLITLVNDYLDADENKDKVDTYGPKGEQVRVGKANKNTRYATTPSVGYSHTSLTTRKKEETMWGSDSKMWELFGKGVGAHIEKGAFSKTDPSGKGNLALEQLPWDTAKQLLPRPLINLIFDVRYQLETGGSTVIDERTPNEKVRKVKSPNAPGTLRSWHQDSPGVLPGNNFLPKKPKKQKKGATAETVVPPHAAALHEHYNATSQSGAGSSITEAATSAQGYAEYTGTGSNWEHNTKIVLDYINKRVYLTLTHYQYWALIKKDDTYEFWPSGTQELSAAKGKLEIEKPGAIATMMSPWMEILMP